jgi:toxin HigB-1
MIKTFHHKGLKELFEQGATSRIDRQFHRRLIERLDVLNRAASLQALSLPGYNVHPLRGKPIRYSLWVSGAWRMTFEWDNGDAYRVDFEQYH